MIIYEFFLNPVGKDIDGEWIKLFNDANAAVNLGGWQIKDASSKTFSFPPEADHPMADKQTAINSGEYLTLDYKTTKISLNNNGETLFLYDANGNLVDRAEYVGNAAEGKSLIRQGDGRFIFAGQTAIGETGVAATQNTIPLNKTDFNFTNLFVGFFWPWRYLLLLFLFSKNLIYY